jgi:hypothetical protein
MPAERVPELRGRSSECALLDRLELADHAFRAIGADGFAERTRRELLATGETRTVEWHSKKVFTKLGISSRKGLPDALPARGDAVAAA